MAIVWSLLRCIVHAVRARAVSIRGAAGWPVANVWGLLRGIVHAVCARAVRVGSAVAGGTHIDLHEGRLHRHLAAVAVVWRLLRGVVHAVGPRAVRVLCAAAMAEVWRLLGRVVHAVGTSTVGIGGAGGGSSDAHSWGLHLSDTLAMAIVWSLLRCIVH